ncbi:MAG TPA: pitrilysin family protein [Thermoanaerobaculia bacterium]|nr:pitrilysin family protein [Thermoanaerobaculia bacterium]
MAEPGPAVAGADAGAAPASSAAAAASVAAAASAAASAASAASAAAAFPGGSCLPGVRRFARLANGLTVCVVENHQAPVVTTALSFRAGTRDEPPGHGGVAHFLEHMMFKGSARFGPGEIDRRTQALGGSNNAFTSHDSTTYYFSFAADRWTEALAIEADRIAALTLDPRQVASERQVIREEIAMYESEPWDALEVAVQARLFRGHPYGRPVLGTRGELRATGREDLASFQRRFYRPDNAVLVVAGQTAEEAVLAQVERFMGGLEPGAERRRGTSPEGRPPAPAPPAGSPQRMARLRRYKGEVARLLLALPAPPGDHPDHAVLRLLVALLGSGRTSRLYRALVDEGQLCSWLQTDLTEGVDASHLTVAAEVVPGVEPARVERELLGLLADLVSDRPGVEEVERARQVAVADWVLHHERVEQQALSLALALALFDAEHLDVQMRRLLAASPEALHEAAGRYLRPELGSVLGWSLPRA